MRPGRNGEVILENRLEGWYVKTGARLLRNKALIQHVKATPVNPEGEKILDPQFTEDVKESLRRVSKMGNFTTAAVFFVYPAAAELHLAELEQSALDSIAQR